MGDNGRKRKIPQLKHTDYRGVGWHVSFRDPQTGMPRKYRFRANSRAEAEQQYHQWLGSYLKGKIPPPQKKRSQKPPEPESPILSSPFEGTEIDGLTGSMLHIVSGLLSFEKSRIREHGSPRQKGTITQGLYNERRHYSNEFLHFLNSRHGKDAVSGMILSDLEMNDVESYNQHLVKSGYSASQVSKRMQFVKSIVSRAGRPEFGSQVLKWNWASLDLLQGKPTKRRQLPSLKQLKLVLKNCEVREAALVWIAIGCGFGQRDLAAIRVCQFDESNYDLRRGKTGIERYGETPKLVWSSITAYLKTVDREPNDLLFKRRNGKPLVHNKSDAIVPWWTKLRTRLGEDCKDLDGFYILRHLGATEYGSRPGCSIGSMKRWLGHSASSQIADVYMKPVSPENKPIIEWVRKSLRTGKANLSLKAK